MMVILCMTSCEKFSANDPESKKSQEVGNVNILVEDSEKDYMGSQLSFGIFQIDQKMKVVHQNRTMNGFGHLSIDLAPGTYRLAVIAHHGDTNCTISSPEKITFPSNKTTDTFYYYGTIEVEQAPLHEEIALSRATGMLTLHINDSIPQTAKRIRFYFTGGSSTFDATTGYGCVNSRQTQVLDMRSDLHDYSIYTFPHEDGKKLKISITILDAEAKSIAELTLTDVEIKRNQVTRYSGNLFDGKQGDIGKDEEGDTQFVFQDRWEGEIKHSF